MIGVGGQEARFGCEFGEFFSCAEGATPVALLKRGILFMALFATAQIKMNDVDSVTT